MQGEVKSGTFMIGLVVQRLGGNKKPEYPSTYLSCTNPLHSAQTYVSWGSGGRGVCQVPKGIEFEDQEKIQVRSMCIYSRE